MLDTLSKSKLITVITNTEDVIFFIKIKKKMDKNSQDYKLCIMEALNNAKNRIKLLDSSDKKCVMDEYREWIKDGLGKHAVLLLREDPII